MAFKQQIQKQVAGLLFLGALVAAATFLLSQPERAVIVLTRVQRWAEQVGILGQTHAESGTDVDNDTYASIASGGTDCYDSLQSQYSDGTVSCDSTAAAAFLESKADGDDDDDIADHAWIKDGNGLYHLYFQNEGTTNQIEHYTSTDLQSLTYVGTALSPGGGTTWDDRLWAPFVFQSGSTYYMVVTGVESGANDGLNKQRIGLATSTDLTTWTKVAVNNCSGTTGNGCIYECNHSWTTWDNGGLYDAQCRDPMVVRDADNNRWVMFADARMTSAASICNNLVGGINVAYSTNLTDWAGQGYIGATCSQTGLPVPQNGGGESENPFVTTYNGTNYLFFTDWRDTEDASTVPNPRTMIQYASSSTLTGDSSGSTNWTYRGYIPDPGVNASEIQVINGDTWIQSQSISNGNSGDAGHTRDLRLKRFTWGSNHTFTTSKLTTLSCRVASSSIHPNVAEICSDNVDANCSGTADEALYCAACTDADGDGYGSQGLNNCSQTTLDCNDNSTAAHPGATETCDQIDNDCDSQTDEGGVCTCEESWSCGTWSACLAGTQARICFDANTCETIASRPPLIQTCSSSVTSCQSSWSCGQWSDCQGGFQYRTCTDGNACAVPTSPPAELKECVVADQQLITVPQAANGTISFYTNTGRRTAAFRAFSSSVGTASVAAGDIDGDGLGDVVAGSGAGAAPVIRAFDALGRHWASFAPYHATQRSGVHVATGDVDGDGQREIITVPASGLRANIRTFRWDPARGSFSLLASFTPYLTDTTGWHLRVGDFDGNGQADLLLVSQGAGAHVVRMYQYLTATSRWHFIRTWTMTLSIDPEAITSADLDADGKSDIITGTGAGQSPKLMIYRQSGRLVRTIAIGRLRQNEGIRLAAVDTDGDGRDELFLAPANGTRRDVFVYEQGSDGKMNFRRTFRTVNTPAAIRLFTAPN